MDYVDFIIFAGVMSFIFCLLALISKAKERYDATHADNEQIHKSRFLD